MADRQPAHRRALGAWYTPAELVAKMVDSLLGPIDGSADLVRVLDPACGDGRLLSAVCDRLGDRAVAVGADIDPATVHSIADRRLDVSCVDGLSVDWSDPSAGGPFDLVIANPPFLSQMSRLTTRGGASTIGGGPYANAAMEFCVAGARALRPGGRMVILLPQSVLTARDAAPLREQVATIADVVDSWWSPKRPFDAEVNVCMLVIERRTRATVGGAADWSSVVTRVLGVPVLPAISTAGTIGDRARATANFRDEYYALVPAVADDVDGPPLITSGLIDPGRCRWGERSVRFARVDHEHPRVDLDKLEGRFRAWAGRMLVPKVLVASQTRIVEAVADPSGAWLPGIPVISVVPDDSSAVAAIEAVLTSPIASLEAWHQVAGSGLSPTSLRLSPALISSLCWPTGTLAPAVRALADGDVIACGRSVTEAFGVSATDAAPIVNWWIESGGLL